MNYVKVLLCVALLAFLGGCVGPFQSQASKDALAAEMLANPPPGAGRYWRECVAAFQDRQPCTEDLRIDREAASMGTALAERRATERAAEAQRIERANSSRETREALNQISSALAARGSSGNSINAGQTTQGDNSAAPSDRQYYPSQTHCIYTVARGNGYFNVGNNCAQFLTWWDAKATSDAGENWVDGNSVDRQHAYQADRLPPKLACFKSDSADFNKRMCYKSCVSGKNCGSMGVAR